jgi:hypothetical protein
MQTAFGGECDTSIELHRDSLCVVLGHEDCALNGFGYDIIPAVGCDHEIARSFFYFKEKQYLCGPKWTITPNIVYQTSKKNNNNKIIYRNEKRYSS